MKNAEYPTEEELRQVIFQPKSAYQKPDCINQSEEHACQNQSSIEAVYGKAHVRCCTEEACKTRAATIAVLQGR